MAADGVEFVPIGRSFDWSSVTLLPPSLPQSMTFTGAVNNRSHSNEVLEVTEMEVSEHPLNFLKLYRSLVGHEQPIA